MNIALLSKDKFLIDFIKTIQNCDVDVFSGNFEKINYNDYLIFILDSIPQDTVCDMVKNINCDFSLIININSYRLNDVINIEIPFKINTLKDHVEKYIGYINKYCIIDEKFKLNMNKSILFINNKNIFLTEKECLLLRTLYEQKKVYKDDLLKIVCGYDDNSKAIETLIYNVRFKLKNNGIEDFIICQDGFYKLNLI